MTIDKELRAIIDRFDFPGTLADCEEIVTGHINRTYRLRFDEGGASREFVLQRINGFAFKKPLEVMENVRLVTEHLREAMLAQGRDPQNRVLRLIPTRDGQPMLLDAQGDCWRAYDFIQHARTVNAVDTPAQFREIGRAFGDFQNMLADFPIEKLHDTIPHFHDTRQRLENFESSVAKDVAGRAASVAGEIAFARARRGEMCRIVEMIESGEMPLRVTHNDTKINNVLFDPDTRAAMCVVDLDTVMPGLAGHDFGDAVRSAGNSKGSSSLEFDKVSLDLNVYRAFAEGFLSQTATLFTDDEISSLPDSCLVMTLELASRYLDDYLTGDNYFKVKYETQNLDRARNLIALAKSMDNLMDQMRQILREIVG